MRWPDDRTVCKAIESWIEQQSANRGDLRGTGYFGSYARGDWSVGSDVDLIVVVESETARFERRAARWDTASLPVPIDLLVYTVDEWKRLRDRDNRFARMLAEEVVWVIDPAESRVKTRRRPHG